MVSRSVLLGLSVAVVGGLVALYVLVIRDSPAATSEPTAPVASRPVTTNRPAPALPGSTGSAAPRLADDSPAPPGGEDMIVHDQRGSGGDNVVIPGTGEDHRGRRIDAGLVRSLHANAEAMLANCTKAVGKDDRGPRPRLDLKLKIAISDHTLRVIEATPELEDMTGPAVDKARDCVRMVAMGIEVPAPDEADVDTYDLHYRYVVH